MVLLESDEYIHKDTNYRTNIIEIKGGVVTFIYFDEDNEYQTAEMTVENFKLDFIKKV